jgi:predicted O-methyltransferase YrrM
VDVDKPVIDVLSQIVKTYPIDLSAPSPIKCKHLTRENLAGMLTVIGVKNGVEVGVSGGRFSQSICARNPGIKFYGVDPYSIEENNDNFKTQEDAEYAYATALRRCKAYDYTLIRKTSAEGVKEFKDGSLDFVYLDGNHMYDHVIEDVRLWSKKVRVGGILSGHDYMLRNENCQVTEAINDYTKANGIAPWIIFGRIKSWLWVKK